MKEVVIRDFCGKDWPAVCVIQDSAKPIELKGSCDQQALRVYSRIQVCHVQLYANKTGGYC
ncbi:hypothetical protein M3P05_15120 [Sansalvadorimonas sp. 2012CJ34-2]|uniref:Uncharacterized protein n=1 Tax=Parendozoicomonas callyspongiae TaxID=2942213 RepID=A0ABT0PJU7_9GAMM|nr:hypothetical protein [Sansalvadorimonas sp. 2012CJ34-2]MCL6271256.1 hypothetical protein [Sansalvadorimonas sp. 2012CJ34-2]